MKGNLIAVDGIVIDSEQITGISRNKGFDIFDEQFGELVIVLNGDYVLKINDTYGELYRRLCNYLEIAII